MSRPLILACLALLPTSAAAELTVCNVTDARTTIAIGYKGDTDWVSEGWWGIAPNECRTVLSYPLTKAFYYYRITSATDSWDLESYMFCTSSQAFEITGDTECESRGYERARFSEIAMGEGETSHTLTVTPYEIFSGYPDPVHEEEEEEFVETRDGSQGEPYTITGLLSQCEVTDASIQCELHAPPWRYVAYGGDSPDLQVLEDMLDLPPNTPMYWSGELMSYSGATAQVTIHSAGVEGTDPYADLRSRMQGYWTSNEDSQYNLLISGGVFEEWYGGIPSDTRLMEIAESCDGSRGSGPYLIAHDYSKIDAPQCFEIWEATGSFLSLFPLGSMRPLDFSQ